MISYNLVRKSKASYSPGWDEHTTGENYGSVTHPIPRSLHDTNTPINPE